MAILSGELSAMETLAKARALDGAKDAEIAQPAEMPDWKKPIALTSGDVFPSEREKSDLKTMAFEVGL